MIILGGVICIIIALIIGLAYLFFVFTVKNMDKQIAEKEVASELLTMSIFEKEAEILPIRDRISDFSILINGHNSPYNLFGVIEKNCLPSVWFSQLSFTRDGLLVNLSGIAKDFATLEQQMNILKKELSLSSATLDSVSVSDEDGSIEFGLQLIFNPEVFNPNL